MKNESTLVRPRVQITVYTHDKTTTHIIKTEYREYLEAEAVVKYDSCTSAGDLYRKVAKHVRHAKEMCYDYKVDYITFGFSALTQ